ncbi:MAG: hypothetical protein KDB00_05400 [Planctomycetales bacterium]|nr:hypothetical protein [Planctomycetales bacterium]
MNSAESVMSQSVGKRQLQFQWLEFRAMLAGNVLVSVVDGDLHVDGDEHGNVLKLQQLSASDARAAGGGASFRITPDADTSINRNDPGAEIVVSGITDDILIDLGDGNDEVALQGANGRRLRDLVIDAGNGPDAVTITRFNLSGDVRVSAANAINVSVQQSTAAGISVAADNSDRSTIGASDVSSSAVTIRNSNLLRGVSVSSGGPLAVKTKRVTIFPPPVDVCKVPAPPAPFVPCGTVNISGGGMLTADINQTIASDVVVKIKSNRDEFKAGAEPLSSSVTIRKSRFRQNIDLSSDVPLSVNIRQTWVQGEVVIKASGSPSTSGVRNSDPANTIRVVDSVFGSLNVIGSESRDQLCLLRLRVLGESSVQAGGGDDSLEVVDSLFNGLAFFDGGNDTDTLSVLRTRFRNGNKTVNWEVTDSSIPEKR